MAFNIAVFPDTTAGKTIEQPVNNRINLTGKKKDIFNIYPITKDFFSKPVSILVKSLINFGQELLLV